MGCARKVVRVLLTGPPASGKTALATRLAGRGFSDRYRPTDSPETFIWPEIQNKCTIVRVVATTVPGREELTKLRMEVLRKVKFDAVLLVFDVSDPQSFYMLHGFINEILSTQTCPVIIVGNKADVGSGVPSSAHATLAGFLSRRMGQSVVAVRPVSAATREGLEELYSVLRELVLRRIRIPRRDS